MLQEILGRRGQHTRVIYMKIPLNVDSFLSPGEAETSCGMGEVKVSES